MKSSVAAALADAFEYHRRGRLSEAELGYRQVLEREPDQPDALHRLGIIAHQVGRNDLALQLIDRAIALNPMHAAYHNDAGIVLHALGRIDDAIARYRKALALEPNYPKAHNGAGIALKDQGRLDDAADSFRQALRLKPDYIDAGNNLGNVLRARGSFAEAVHTYRKALEIGRPSPALWYNLGNALADLAAFDDAVEAYRNALGLRADFAEARARLADALSALGRPDDAAANYARALVLAEAPEWIAGFVGALIAAELRHVDSDVRRMAIRALSTPWARPEDLAPACMRLLASDAGLRVLIDHASTAWPSRPTCRDLFGLTDPDVVFGDPLLRALLESAPACDLAMERFLTVLRATLLDAVTADATVAGTSALAFGCALARQCFINDYVFSYTDAEIERARALRERVIASLGRHEAPSAMDIAAVAAYFPLWSFSHAETLLTHAWPEPIAALLAQQLREPLEERRCHDRIPRLTTIDDRVSVGVREQYEEHPYPKWIRLPPSGATATLNANPDTRFPAALWQSRDEPGGLDILVAGCGTGQESIEFAQAFPQSRVLAVDLSLASLAYATRKARELRIANIEHGQADLMKLASLGRTFDVISSVGVLHHLAEPERGWRELVAMLAPGGHMLVGLYSERSRQDVIAAKGVIADRGYGPTAHDIRRCRQDLMSAERAGQFSRLALRRDFYVTGECRDLLFHVEEHRYTLPGIRKMLDALGVRFNGFLLTPEVATRYAARYPTDTLMENLENWDAIEAEFPDTFAGMYIFWVHNAP